jgi:tetratricopeptide (TPR) repeat protein
VLAVYGLTGLAALTILAGCATINAKRHFSAGKKAESAGDDAGAIKEYQAAHDAQAANPEYDKALAAARRSAAQKQARAAEEADQKGDAEGALGHWQAAREVDPKSPEWKARAELARQKVSPGEPIERYQATRALLDALPGDPEVAKALDAARGEVLRYYSKLADAYVDSKSFTQAYEAYEKARSVDAENALFKSARYKLVKARRLEALGDQKLKGGDALAAFHAYEEAAATQELPELAAKLKKAKRSAGALIEQLEQAKGFERDKQWEDAAEIYTLVRERSDAPQEVAEAAIRTRKQSAQIRAARAESFAAEGLVDKARATLALALEHTDGPAPALADAAAGLERIEAGDLGAARSRFEAAASAAPELPIGKAGVQLCHAAAKLAYAAAQAGAAKDPAAAMVAVVKLEAYAGELEGYAATKKGLVKAAFKALLERAEARGAEARPEELADLLGTALDISSPPEALKRTLAAGIDGLRHGDLGAAARAFKAALDGDARSLLARSGEKIARTRRILELKKEAQEAAEVEDQNRAAAAYRELGALDPQDAEAKAGLARLKDALLAHSIEAGWSHQQAGRVGSAWVYARRALDLDPANLDAAALMKKLEPALSEGGGATPRAWVAPVARGERLGDACAGAEKELREALILYLQRTPKLGATFLSRDENLALDAAERGHRPPVELAATLEECSPGEAGGTAAVVVRLVLAGRPVGDDRLAAKFDRSTLPKDEREEAMKPEKVRRALINDAARAVAVALPMQAEKLAGWRGVEASQRIKSGDDEGAARVYAALAAGGAALSAAEQATLRDLERYVQSRFR